MPELIRLRTPDFELSIWTNDISHRLKVYQSTLANRASLTPNISGHNDDEINAIHTGNNTLEPSYVLRFSPAIELESINVYPSIGDDQNDSIKQTNNTTEIVKKYAELTLNSPLFFENTHYQFEWVFLREVTAAYLTHRSQSVNDAFQLKAARGSIPARLTGTINTGNDVGWLRLPLTFECNGKSNIQYIAFEVLPTKMLLHQDLCVMYQAIDQVYPLWRFSLVEKTEQAAATSKQRGHFPLMWLANFTALRARFEQGLNVICTAPHSRLLPTISNIKAAKLKGRLPHKLATQVKQYFANGHHDKHYQVEKKQLSVDTPENRFIKMVANHSKRQLAKFEAELRESNQAPESQRLSDSFLNELHSWQQPLQKVLRQSFLKDVSPYTGLRSESLVLQQKTGYSMVYRVWQELKFYLDVFGNHSSISMKSIAEIYEVWCFLCLKQILEQDLNFELIENGAAKLEQNKFLEYQFEENGFAGAFSFKRADGVMARLAHEPQFTKKGRPIRSYLVNQEPDIVLEVTLPKTASSNEEKKFIWLFDAKYRIKTDNNRFDNHEDIDTTDHVPDDAINQMHRYRDALIHLSYSPSTPNQPVKKSRPVLGAFALYPGFFDQTIEQNPYATAIEEIGIGAFALLPSQTENDYSGRQWLLQFLQTQIGTPTKEQSEQDNALMCPMVSMVERLYAQEAARIPYYGMRQVLYPDLTMTAALAGQHSRDKAYFERFKQGSARWYHLRQNTFSQKFKQHIAQEIRYLALASTFETQSSSKEIERLWPVKHVTVLPRYQMTTEQTGKSSNATEPYYLFELGKPLTLQTLVTNVPHRPMINSMKLTTLTRLESVTKFVEVEKVYEEALLKETP